MSSRIHAPFFYVDPPGFETGSLHIEGDDAGHLPRVRRAQPGERVTACDGAGSVVEAVLRSVSRDRISAEIIKRRFVYRPKPRATVIQGLGKGRGPDFVIQKLVELGVDDIAILAAGRSVPGRRSDGAEGVRQRWQKVAIEASKQSRRAWLPCVRGPIAAHEAAELAGACDLALLADPASDKGLKTLVPVNDLESVAMMIGPEGGFNEEEVKLFTKTGAVAISLGNQILRTETAAIVFAALVLFHFGRLGGS